MRGRNRIPGFLTVLSIVCLTDCMSSPQEDSQGQKDRKRAGIVLKVGEVSPEDNINTQVLHYFADRVRELPNGRIIAGTYAGSRLGDEQTELQAIQTGTLDIFRGNILTMGDLGMDKMGIFGLPYLFEGRDHLWSVLKNDSDCDISDNFWGTEMDTVRLTYVDEGVRDSFAKKSIERPDDLKGAEIRVAETPILLGMVSYFGVSPTPIPMNELYISSQTSVVDRVNQPLSGYISNDFGEIAPHVTLDNYIYTPNVIIMSGYCLSKLSAED